MDPATAPGGEHQSARQGGSAKAWNQSGPTQHDLTLILLGFLQGKPRNQERGWKIRKILSLESLWDWYRFWMVCKWLIAHHRDQGSWKETLRYCKHISSCNGLQGMATSGCVYSWSGVERGSLEYVESPVWKTCAKILKWSQKKMDDLGYHHF